MNATATRAMSERTDPNVLELMQGVARRASGAGVFGEVAVRDGRLVCAAKASAQPAEYRLVQEGGKIWVLLAMKDRWLSESIEADLMHTGDKLEELIEEELADQGQQGGTGSPPAFEHFRSEEKEFTFRSVVPVAVTGKPDERAVTVAGQWLLAYEACFRELGNMEVGQEEA